MSAITVAESIIDKRSCWNKAHSQIKPKHYHNEVPELAAQLYQSCLVSAWLTSKTARRAEYYGYGAPEGDRTHDNPKLPAVTPSVLPKN
jgi:hypothetical protein